ncbi:MAG: YceI family protein [Gemmataceae bacterium]
MRRSLHSQLMAFSFSALLAFVAAPVQAADYAVDDSHSSVTFKIGHLGISEVHGRFDDMAGSFEIDKGEPEKSSFMLTIKTESVDTNNKKRDDHLRSPDFFNVKQFPAITFKSTKVALAKDKTYVVTGDLTMHGKTKSISFNLKGGKEVEFPKGTKRVGFTTELTLKRSEFGMEKMAPAIGDEVQIAISIEGATK